LAVTSSKPRSKQPHQELAKCRWTIQPLALDVQFAAARKRQICGMEDGYYTDKGSREAGIDDEYDRCLAGDIDRLPN